MIELIDDMGEPFCLEQSAQRVISLVPSITETLFALGAGARIVGVTDFCIHPREEVRVKPRVGGTKNISVEKILSLDPDLVIANAEENRKHHIDRLRAAGVRVFVTFPRTIDQCLKMMADVAALVEAEEAGRQIMEAIAQAREEACSSPCEPPPRVFCPIWKDPYMSINRDTFVDSVVREAGGRNIFEDSSDRYPQVTLAEVAFRKPDLIILPTEPYHFTEEDIVDFRALGETVPAVRKNRIHIFEGELLSWYGPRVPRALKALSALFRSV